MLMFIYRAVFIVIGVGAGYLIFPEPIDRKQDFLDTTESDRKLASGNQGLLPPAIIEGVSVNSTVTDRVQVEQLTPLYNPKGQVKIPVSALKFLEFQVGNVGEKFSVSSQVATAYQIQPAQKKAFEGIISGVITDLREQELKLAKMEAFTADEMVVSVPPGAWKEIAWSGIVGRSIAILGEQLDSEVISDLLTRIKWQIENEYPPTGRRVGVKLGEEKGIWVGEAFSGGKTRSNFIPKSLTHLVRVAEETGQK